MSDIRPDGRITTDDTRNTFNTTMSQSGEAPSGGNYGSMATSPTSNRHVFISTQASGNGIVVQSLESALPSSTSLSAPLLDTVVMGSDGAVDKPERRDDVDEQKIQLDEDHLVTVEGYRWSNIKMFFTYIFVFLTLGVLRLVLHWKAEWMLKMMAQRANLRDATVIMLRGEAGFESVIRAVRTTEMPDKNQYRIAMDDGTFISTPSLRFFTYRKIKYVWNGEEFVTLNALDVNVPIARYIEIFETGGIAPIEAACRWAAYGANIIEVKVKPVLVLTFREAITPFYCFQVFSVLIWYNDEYVYYATVIVLMSVLSIGVDVSQTHKQEVDIRNMVHSTDVVTVVRDKTTSQMSSMQLVPGDLIELPSSGCVLQCDAVLMSGSCIVNEAMLTGESVPVTKTHLPNEPNALYDKKEHAKHTLFCGTQVLQTRFYQGQPVRALVIRTGYQTLKGQLVRSIMYPKPVDFSFTKDLMRFIGFLAVIAAFGLIYSMTIMYLSGAHAKKIILRSLDIITIVVPPALPAAMTIGIIASQMRLRKKKIFCISPSTINTCGGVNVVVFDKTGTLTEDGLDFLMAIPVADSGDDRLAFDHQHASLKRLADYPIDGALVKAAATCHSLTRIEGEIRGDPLDLVLFAETGWSLTEPQQEESAQYDQIAPSVVSSPVSGTNAEPAVELGILRQLTFSSNLQRMSVIVSDGAHGELTLYCKGAPEKVASLCLPESVPPNFHQTIGRLASKGYRLIALAQKSLKLNFVKVMRKPREELESELTLLGIVALENRLKPQTTPVINQLHAANVRTIMCTGDNLLTGVSVAMECGIVDRMRPLYLIEQDDQDKRRLILSRMNADDGDEFEGSGDDMRKNIRVPIDFSDSSEEDINERNAENGDIRHTGKAGGVQLNSISSHLADYQLAIAGPTLSQLWHEMDPSTIDRIVFACCVYARMSPDQKQLLVNRAQEMNYTVAMCGDGANDCGALKAAHAGISLSEAEASIASPFTSQTPDIRCVATIISEGRAALVTSFGMFKYMATYSITQFISVLLLYWIATNLADFQFLYEDLFLITTMAIFFGYQEPADNLAPKGPASRILSLTSVASVLGVLAIIAAAQLTMFIVTTYQPWFMPFADPGDDNYFYSYQGTAIFCLSTFQYISLAIIYSKGKPHRKSILNNYRLCITIVIVTTVSLWIAIYPPGFLVSFLNLLLAPVMNYRLLVIFVSFVCCALCYCWEKYAIDILLDKWANQPLTAICGGTVPPKYEELKNDYTSTNITWLISALSAYNRQTKTSVTSDSTDELVKQNGDAMTSHNHQFVDEAIIDTEF